MFCNAPLGYFHLSITTYSNSSLYKVSKKAQHYLELLLGEIDHII